MHSFAIDVQSIGMGLHHSGVEILGKEYSFASGGGIFDSTPKDAPGAKFRESIELGAFDGGSMELQSAIFGEMLHSILRNLRFLRHWSIGGLSCHINILHLIINQLHAP